MNLRPVGVEDTPPTPFISIYKDGYMRANNYLTDLLKLSAGDYVCFYTNDEGEYFFGKQSSEFGHKVRKQKRTDAMIWSSAKMGKELKEYFKISSTTARLHVNEKYHVVIHNNKYYHVSNYTESGYKKPDRQGTPIGQDY